MAQITLDEFDALLPSLVEAAPSEREARLGEITIDEPYSKTLRGLDPFSSEYKEGVLKLYLRLRGGGGTYDPSRDERCRLDKLGNVWLDYPPWAYRNPSLITEHLFSWAQIAQHLQLGADSGARVLEYGPGSGHLILLLSRMGLKSYAVDIDQHYLDVISAQAQQMGLVVHTERAEFGSGFSDETFDRIIFFEAFHHCLDFVPLLQRLKTRLKPSGKLIMAGEPIVAHEVDFVPYPWGPRLDGLSVFCIRHLGWMELGFTEEFFFRAMKTSGFNVTKSELYGCSRATTYVAEPMAASAAADPTVARAPQHPLSPLEMQVKALEAENAAMKASSSWRLTAPLRSAVQWMRGLQAAG